MEVIEQSTHNVARDTSGGSVLRAILVYEDSVTGLRAVHALDGLPGEILLEPSIQTRLWRCDLLQAALLREQAVIEAVAADVIILSVHGERELPEPVRQWLLCWREKKEDRPYALGILLDAGKGNPSAISPVKNYVVEFLQGLGVDLFLGFYEPVFVRSIPVRDCQWQNVPGLQPASQPIPVVQRFVERAA